MMGWGWFPFALLSTFGWGTADLFYKSGTDENDPLSHLKIAVWVGLVMGVCSIVLLPFAESGFDARSLLTGALRYTPASLCYIISMVVGYAGLRYLELSVVSPLQNASGAFSAVCMLAWFIARGRLDSVKEAFTPIDLTGTVIIVIGVIALAFAERADAGLGEEKYRFGAKALIFPLMYCLFDTIGTAADGVILDEETGMGLGEIDVLVLYGLTFLLAGVVAWLWMRVRHGVTYNPFAKGEHVKGIAACCEELGQVFYVFAMAARPVLAAPMIASYCIVSVLLSRVFLKEKLGKVKAACVTTVIVGIVLLGIAEGISEI